MKTQREFVRIAESEPLVLAVSALADYLWEDFIREARPIVNYLVDRYDIKQLSRFGKELFDYLYNGSAVTPLVSLEAIETYFRESQDGQTPSFPEGYKPEAAFWVGLFNDICSAPAWPLVVQRCVGDQFNSGNNAVNIINELSEVIDQQIQERKFPVDLIANGGEQLRQLREEFIEAKKAGDDAKAAEIRQQGKELGKRLEEAVKESRELIQPQTANIVDRAEKKSQETSEGISSLAGDQVGTGSHGVDLAEKQALASKLAKNRKLKQLANRLGGLRKAWNDRKRAKRVRSSYSDIVGAKFSDDVTKAFPIEIALAGTEEGRALFALKYSQKTLFTKDFEAKSKEVDKGPVVMYIDISGSMAGDCELWSKAIAFIIADECLKQRREIQIHLFDTIIHNSITLEANRKDNAELLNFVMTWITKGGTSFSEVINHALTKADISPKADVLLITDGHSNVPDAFVRRLNLFKNEHGINWNSFCIGNTSDALELFSDSVQTVDIYSDPESSDLFQEVLKS